MLRKILQSVIFFSVKFKHKACIQILTKLGECVTFIFNLQLFFQNEPMTFCLISLILLYSFLFMNPHLIKSTQSSNKLWYNGPHNVGHKRAC